jgi:small subunit ribosomal protein S9
MEDKLEKANKKIEEKNSEPLVFKGRFLGAVGKRKTAIAQVRLYKNGTGIIAVNGVKISKYFSYGDMAKISQLLKLVGLARELNFSVKVKGGGQKAQSRAVLLGMAKALIEFNKELRPAIKTKGWLTRDSRKKERKKPGLKRARRAPQWQKR